eukprot:Phypoly_transcript_02506.p1 GENE.Phypoly_transcript_02506~~Phypoly_transcript_02506.p1  ORF type:complete len:633 (+),score=81.79 Phypoly_transcript_02506:79-1977(+)
MAKQGWLVLFVFAFLCIVHAEVFVKHLAGPPSEFVDYIPLAPSDFPDVQHSATFKVHLSVHHDKNVLAKTIPLVVDSYEQFRFALFSPHSSLLELSLKDPLGNIVQLQGSESFVPIGEQQIPGIVYIINEPIQGEYQLQIKTSLLDEPIYQLLTTNSKEDAYIIMWNEAPLAMHTTLNTFEHVTGSKVGLVTGVFDSSLSFSGYPNMKAHKQQIAQMNVLLPDGVTLDIPMQDDGFSADGEPSDGIYGALITVAEAGQYIFEASISGTDEFGVQYVRTTSQIVRVVSQSLALSGTAMASVGSHSRIVAYIGVSAPLGRQYNAYAEVWGTDSTGKDVPISWIGGMANVESTEEGTFIPLELDLNWISMAGAHEPLTLRNVMIKDPDYFVPIAQYDEIPVKTTFDLDAIIASQTLKGSNDVITDEMRLGIPPARNLTVAPTVYTILVHGYCSASNPFTSGTWTNGKFFLKANANMLNDAFAKSVIAWADQNGLQAYSFVGHSQGGMVGAHMLNYYWTGLDQVTGGRIAQTLGTPFSGCSAAGNAANLGSLFGISCGANDNLVPTGAVQWLQGITSSTRSKISYYTTTYALNQPFGDYCNLAMNLILDFPNDGTTEFDRAQLSGATNAGTTQVFS